jgi:hypothetical protein
MTGGLIQLVTTGIQDSPIIGNPEITFFKTVYRQHTQFSICQNERYIGSLEFDKSSSKIIEKNGDLLYNQYFKLEIPYFEILKSTMQSQQIVMDYNINKLDVQYGNSNCIVLYLDTNKSWYIIPDNLFKLSTFEQIIYLINSYELEENLLPEYIKTTSFGQYVNYYQIKDNDLSSIISILRVNSNFFEQFWLDIISKSSDVNIFNRLVTLQSEYNSLFGKLKNRIFNLFYNRNFSARNVAFYNFSKFFEQNKSLESVNKVETERYFEYINSFDEAIKNLNTYDMDTSYKYVNLNFLNWDDYKNNVLPYNTKLILLMFELLYSNDTLDYVFWKKYNILDKNEVNFDVKIDETNFVNEWQENLNLFLSEYVGVTFINNQIYETLKNNFYGLEKKIEDLFKNLILVDPKSIYIKLKTILNRFYQIPNYQLNFNDNYLSTIYPNGNVVEYYNEDNYKNSKDNEQIKYPTLKNEYKILDNTNEMNNLTPVDLINILGIIAEEIVDASFNFVVFNKAIKSFFVLWKNSIYNRLYKRFIDTYKNIKNNGPLYDFTNDRKLTLYYSIYPSNLYDFNDFKQSFYEMFWRNSWIGSLSIEFNDFEKMKENIFDIQSYNLFATNFKKENNNFYKLNIGNTYTYTYISTPEKVDNYNKTNFKFFNYDVNNNKIWIKYDNYYDSNSKITLNFDGINLTYSTIQNEMIVSEYNIKCLYLSFSGLQVSISGVSKTFSSVYTELNLIGKNLIMTVNYETYIPLVCFMEQNIISIEENVGLNVASTVINGVYIIDNNILYLGEGGIWVPQGSKKYIINSTDPIYKNKFIKTLSDGTIIIMQDNYPNIQSNKYWLITKFSNNEPQILNIVDNQIIIENSIPNTDTIKILTINYYRSDVQIARPPSTFTLTLDTTTNTKTVTPGEHIYAISYYNINEETDISDIKIITVTENNNKIYINNIPISEDKNVIGRRIYRTKANDNKFYLLVDMKNNSINTFEDNIHDDELGIEYDIDNNIKYIKLPSLKYKNPQEYDSLDRTEKQLIKLVGNEALYTVTDMNGNIINLPTDYRNIYEMYIEEIKLPFEIISTNEYYINSDGYVILDSYKQTDISKLMYLTNSSNLSENYKLTCSKQNIPFGIPTAFILTDINKPSGGLSLGLVYKYKISYFSTRFNLESQPSDIISLDGPLINNAIQIDLTSPIYDESYDSYKIYRNLASIDGSVDTYFHIATLLKDSDTIFIDTIADSTIYSNIDISKYQEYSNPFFYISRQINSSLINRPGIGPLLEIISTGNVNVGTHEYMVSYYNWNTKEETFTSESTKIIITDEPKKIKVTIPISPNLKVNTRKIYRSTSDGNFYLLTEIKNNSTTIYNDDISDITLINSTNFLPTINRPNYAPRLIDAGVGGLSAGVYKYKMTFYNSNTNEETIGSICNEITLAANHQVLVTIPGSIDTRVTDRRLYRTKVNGNIYYRVTTLPGFTIDTFIDNILDSSLNTELVSEIKKGIQYKVMKVPIENVVPNLNNFISHSTDINLINNKQLSDLNDYLFNKPFGMFVNNSTLNNFSSFYDVKKSFKSSNLIFYNIPFNITPNSIISLDDLSVNYLMPISTQQFFIKESDLIEPYYKNNFDTNSTISCASNEIIQRRFSPAFDEFDMTGRFLNLRYYRDIMVDNIVVKIEDVLTYNPDYLIIVNLLNSVNKYYSDTFLNLLKSSNSTLYGSTSVLVLNRISSLNKLNTTFNDKTPIYNLYSYSNQDYIKYSHAALKIYDDPYYNNDTEYIKLAKSSNIINILTPVWDHYNSNTKISSETVFYLKNIPNFFNAHISYVNDNINYLNISNQNNYKEQFLSFNEIQQNKFNNFYDYSGNNTIILSHPIIDSNIYKIKIYDDTNISEITSFKLDSINKTKLTTTDFTKSIQKNNYYNAEYKLENRNQQQNSKFNYLGFANVDNEYKFIYEDQFIPKMISTYYMTDDNKIIKGQYNSSIGRYTIGLSSNENKSDIPDMLVISPTEIVLNNLKIGTPTITLESLSNILNYYKVKVNINMITIGSTVVIAGIPNGIGAINNFHINSITNILYQGTGTDWAIESNKSYYITGTGNLTFDNKYWVTKGDGTLKELNLQTDFLINNKFINGFYKQDSHNQGTLTIITPYILTFDSNDFIFMETPTDYNTWILLSNVSNYIVEKFKKVNYKSLSTTLSANYFKLANKYYDFSTNIEVINIINYSNNGTYFYFDSQALSSYISISAPSGISTSIPTIDQIGKYIIDTNKLYIGTLPNSLNGSNSWVLVKDKYFKINNLYCKIEWNGTVTTEIDILVANIYLYTTIPTNTFTTITANKSDSISIINAVLNNYIIVSSKLYIGTNISTWIVAPSGYYLISSDLLEFDGQLVRVDDLGNIIIWEPIISNSILPISPTLGDYYIDIDKLKYYDGTLWNLVSEGHYLITSDNSTYNNKKVKTEYDGSITIINEIKADSGLTSTTAILGTYMISVDKLYIGIYENGLKWRIVTDGEYILKSDISIYNTKCIKPDPNGFLTYVNLRNKILLNKKTTMLISNNQVYSYFKNFSFSKQLREVDNDNYILLVDLTKTPNRHFMFKKKDIVSSKIPFGSYHSWYIPKDYLNLVPFNVNITIDNSGTVSNISNIPTHSYYLIKNGNFSCIYYYESGNTISISDNISYYQVKNVVSITQIYMIDNKLFNIDMKQLISLYKTKQASENFITKELTKNSVVSNFTFDSTYDLAYQSEFIKSSYDVDYFDNNTLQLISKNEELVNMILKRTVNNNVIYYPIIIKKEESFTIPNVSFNYGLTSYTKSFIVIDTSSLSLGTTILLSNYTIGTISGSTPFHTFYSLSPYLEISGSNIILKAGFDIVSLTFGLYLWKVKGLTPDDIQYNFYFWTLITNNTILADDYLSVDTNNISEPFYLSPNNILSNYGINHTLVTSTPNILSQNGNNFILKIDDTINRKIGYKYYSNTRHIDTTNYLHDVLELDHSMVFNVKPYIDPLAFEFSNTNFTTLISSVPNLFKDGTIYIATYLDSKDYKKKMYVATKSDLTIFTNKLTNSNIATNPFQYAIYYSLNYPHFVSNYITIYYSSNDIYEIAYYKKLFLELGEIICVDGNYFYVEGINIFTNKYELTLMRTGNNLKYSYDGYYTLGNYLRNDNRIMPPINYENTMKLNSSITISIGDIHYSNQNSQLTIPTYSSTLSNVNLFGESSLKIKLLYKNGRLFLFDNFIQLEILNKLIPVGSTTIYEIVNIRDNEIILNNTFGSNSITSNTFVEFIVPYQPFESKYIEFDLDGTIKSETFIDNQTLIFNIYQENKQAIIANGFLSLPAIVTIGTYVIDNVTSKLYIGTISNVWEPVNGGIYLLESTNAIYHNSYSKVSSDGTLTVFINITANKKALPPYTPGTYLINNDSLELVDNLGIANRIVSGYYRITSDILKYNGILVTFDKNDNLLIYNNIYTITNNKINVEKNFIAGYYWVRLWKTNYTSFFKNSLYVPTTYSTTLYQLNNTYPIKIEALFDYDNSRFKILNNNIISSYEFYYLEPVKYSGTYNLIKEIKQDGNNMYIYLKNPIILKSDLANTNIELIISPRFNNQYEYYSNLKFKYNFGIQPVFYNTLKPLNTYPVVRYILKNNELIFIQKYNTRNKPLIFEYGKNVKQNEILNEISDDYESVYFYEYSQVNSDGTFNNYDTLIGTWHIHVELFTDWNVSVLSRVIYPNILQKYNFINKSSFPDYIDRVFGIKSNVFNEFTYSPLSIIESKNMIEINNKLVEIIVKYDVKVIGMPITTTISKWVLQSDYYYDSTLTKTSLVKNGVYIIDMGELYLGQNNIWIQPINGIYDSTITTILSPVLENTYIKVSDKIYFGVVNYIWSQEISFITTFNNNIYKSVYLDEKLNISYKINYINNKYYIESPNYISNQIKTLYTKNINYLVSAIRTNTLKTEDMADITNEFYIDTRIIDNELLSMKFKVSKINPDKLLYKYKLIDDSNIFSINPIIKYNIQSVDNSISIINNDDRTIVPKSKIDYDLIEISQDYVITTLFLFNPINLDNISDPIRLFNSVKQLRVKLLEKSIIKDLDVFNNLKPWNSWSILNAVKIDSALNGPIINSIKLKWNGTSVIKINATNQFLTNNEIKQLSSFLQTVNTEPIAKANYIIMRDNLEPLIINNLSNWLNNPDFFLDPFTRINEFLSSTSYKVSFNGTNIIFDNDTQPTYITIDGINEISSYITNEFTYNDFDLVERTTTNFNNINTQINNWIEKITMNNINDRKFGVSIHKVLRYLVQLGKELVQLINYMVEPFNDTPDYVYNNPIKFIINKLWEKYNKSEPLVKLEKEFNDTLTIFNNYNLSTQVIGGIIYLENLTLRELGIFVREFYKEFSASSALMEFNISNLLKYEPNILKQIDGSINLISNPIYPYTVNFYNYEINTDSLYSIDLLNGQIIVKDLQIQSPIIYPDQIQFYSDYNIKPTDFIIIKEKTNYQIISNQLLGHAYEINLNNISTLTSTLDVSLIDEIYFRNYKLNIVTKDIINKLVIVLIPIINTENIQLINYTDLIELKNYLAIKKVTYNVGKQYISFYNNTAINTNFIINKTLLKTNSNLYILKKDITGYYVEGPEINLSEYNITITILINPKIITDLREVYYLYNLNPSIQNTYYGLANVNLMVSLEFKLVESTTKKEITPTAINNLGDNNLILHYSIEDYNTIIASGNWNTISHTKRLDQKLINKIEEITLKNEYLYFFEGIIPKVNTLLDELTPKPTTTIFTYDITTDINIPNGIYEPTVNPDIKTSIYFNQIINNTYFTIINDYTNTELINNIGYIQKNNWNLPNYNTLTTTEINSRKPNYKYNGTSISITVPSDFVYKSGPKYYYKFANNVIDSTQFIFTNNILTFNWIYNQPINNQDFQQYYIEQTVGLINIPSQNRKAEFSINYPYQYTSKDKFYMLPYSGNGNEFDEYLYKIEISEKTLLSGSNFKSAYNFINIYIYSENGDLYTGKIFDQYYSSNKLYYIISLKNNIDLLLKYTYYLDNNVEYPIITIDFYQNSLQLANFYEQTQLSKVSLFVNKSIHEYNYINISYPSIIAPIYSTNPVIGPSGNFYINSTTNKLYKSNGTNWIIETLKRYWITSATVNKYDGKYISTLSDGIIVFDTVVSKPNKFYLVSYVDYLVTNIFNENKFVQNKDMKREIQTTTTIIQTTEIPKWPHPSRLINYIRLYFNDQLIEEMNEDTYYMLSYLYQNIEGRNQLENITKFRLSNNKWEIYIPLIFWFSKRPGLAIPTIAMPNTEIRLEYKLNSLNYILDNDLTSITNYKFKFNNEYLNNIVPIIKITLCNEFILLDTIERKLFGSFSHEYIIERNLIYPNNYINEESTILAKKYSGLVKDIYMITKLKANPKIHYIPNQYIKNDNRDAKYKRYQQALIYHAQYIINNVYTSNEQRDYAIDIEIITQNNSLLNHYMEDTFTEKAMAKYDIIRNLINFFSTFEQWDSNYNFLKYLMYYQVKYLSAFNITNSSGKINSILTTYIKYQYNTEIIWEEESFINNLTIRANGTDLFSERDWIYFNSVVPVTKFKNSLPIGFYVYTFSLYPTDEQYSGHLNFTNFDDIILNVQSNSLIVNGKGGPYPYVLSTIIKEYNILRIMSGFGSMAWIN